MEIKKDELKKLEDSALEEVAGGYAGGMAVASGSFTSNSGTNLNLVVIWNVISDSFGQRTLQVQVNTTSYALVSAELYNGVQMTLNGITYSTNSKAINYRGAAMASHPLAAFTIPNFVGPANATVVFHFNGTLSGRPVNDIIATGTISA